MKLGTILLALHVAACVLVEISCITNQEFLELAKDYTEDGESFDNDDITVGLKDSSDVIDLPGNANDELDVEYLLKKLETANELQNDQEESLDIDPLDENVDELNDLSADTVDELDDDPADTDGELDVEDLLIKLDPATGVEENSEADSFDDDDDIDFDDKDVFELTVDTDDDIDINELQLASRLKEPELASRNGKLGFWRRVRRIIRHGRQFLRRVRHQHDRRYSRRYSRGRSSRRYSRGRRYSRSGRSRRRSRRYGRRFTPKSSVLTSEAMPATTRPASLTENLRSLGSRRSFDNCSIKKTFRINLLQRFRVRFKACVRVVYLPKTQRIRLTISNNDTPIVDAEVNPRNPSPLCYGIPGLRTSVRTCVGIYNINPKSQSMCLRLTASIPKQIKDSRYAMSLGCVHLPTAVGLKGANVTRLLENLQKSIETMETGQNEEVSLPNLSTLYRQLQLDIAEKNANLPIESREFQELNPEVEVGEIPEENDGESQELRFASEE